MPKIQRTCAGCGKQFLAWPKDVRRGSGKFCSRECAAANRPPMPPRPPTRVRLVCKRCDKPFLVKPNETRRRGGAKYCSRECFRAKPRMSVWARFVRHVVPDAGTGCILWGGALNDAGYGTFSYRTPAGMRHVTPARFAFELAHGPIPPGMEVCHDCPGGDNPRCCNPMHLFIGTRAENLQDASRKGRMACGVKHHFSKLTEDQVLAIRSRHAAGGGVSQAQLARDYDTCPANVRAIITRLRWKHLPPE